MAGLFPKDGFTFSSNTVNALSSPEITEDCEALWYANRCNARFDPSQANAVISEIINAVNLREIDYDCESLDNLAQAINICSIPAALVLPDTDDGIAGCWDGEEGLMPVSALINLICASCAQSGDGVTITEDSPFATIPQGVVSQICGNTSAKTALAACLRSGSAGNQIVIGGDNLLYVAASSTSVPAFGEVGSYGIGIPAGDSSTSVGTVVNAAGGTGPMQFLGSDMSVTNINVGNWRHCGAIGADSVGLWVRIS